ncbi:MAG: hypothetical protein NT076_00465 [Candidatus Pacearchaeota archaeon]|nr:hypothetical protein [Candidatus Pacearchaeota archaeon]
MREKLPVGYEPINGVHGCEFNLPKVNFTFRVLRAYILPNETGIFFYEILEKVNPHEEKFRGQYFTCGRIPRNREEALDLIERTYEGRLEPIED